MKLIFNGTAGESKSFKEMLKENCPILNPENCDCVCRNDGDCPYIEMKIKYWRAANETRYYFLILGQNLAENGINSSLDTLSQVDDWQYNIGNYFQTKEEAEKVMMQIKTLLTSHRYKQ